MIASLKCASLRYTYKHEKQPRFISTDHASGTLFISKRTESVYRGILHRWSLAQSLTTLPGSSAWFDCGWVTYSNTAKQKLLNVPKELIVQHGAVSEPVAIAMAMNALQLSNAALAISITGIAGPSGGSIDKPVGTVWLAWQLREYAVITRCEHFLGDRRNMSTSRKLGTKDDSNKFNPLGAFVFLCDNVTFTQGEIRYGNK